MKKVFTLVGVLMLGLTMTFATAQTRGRQNTGNNKTPAVSTNNQATSRPSTPNSRPAGNTGAPGNVGNASQRPSTPNPPSNPGNNNNFQGNPGANNRPGGNPPGGNPPGGPGYNRPNTPPPPPSGPQPPRPSGYVPGYSYRPPMTYTPPSYYYYRPTPPPNWRPSYGAPTFGNILGLTLGAILSNSVNSLITGGYHVSGYNNNEVYLNNVNYCNVNWPNVTMYYNNGRLRGSLFSSSSISYDVSRYNYLYSYLTSMYGMPISSQNLNGGGMACTWWGYSDTYLTLSFYPEYVYGLGNRYFTTLSTGY